MQTRSEPRTNTANDRSFRSWSASRPSTSRTVTFRPSDLGGVWGSAKEKTPRTAEQTAAILRGVAVASSFKNPTRRPARIQPTVPKTRMAGNCFSGLVIWLKEMAFTRARVGL